ncbi:hypothetical protein QG37_02702 [Candidozyma auris]|uniref:Uncharacterized protein n=1 Tax=Candidozyma auris TaxID=498019 RepID=A0A0L0P1D7_CANAR|nr:hypothetical protein QG37_02702 [[Candida] auris]
MELDKVELQYNHKRMFFGAFGIATKTEMVVVIQEQS